MFDRRLVRSILLQIDDAIDTIQRRSANVTGAAFFTYSPDGKEKLDAICMLFMAVGESVKNVNKITAGQLLSKYPEIDWTGVIGFRDIIAHHYFDVDADQVFWIIQNELSPLSGAIKDMLRQIDL